MPPIVIISVGITPAQSKYPLSPNSSIGLVDSLITLTRKVGLFIQTNDYIILKDLKYIAPEEEL